MKPLHVFVASSTEGSGVARALRQALQSELGRAAVVEFWSHKFEFGDTAIEALEAVADSADFAVVVMTPDDRTDSRLEVDKPSPRDNLVFELGLFIGALGRERSIVARDPADAMKLPSDILSVTALSFDRSAPDRLEASLQAEVVGLAARITELGARPKWLSEGRKALAANARFSAAIAGTWWEKVNHPGGSGLSCFTIVPDVLGAGVVLDGTAYDETGEACALWTSEMARLYPQDRRLTYLWRGKHPLPGLAQLQFHGYASMTFQWDADVQPLAARGDGDFWDVDEFKPANTVMKPVELRRIVDAAHLDVMATGSRQARREIVLKVLADW